MELLVRIIDKRDLKDPVKDAQLTKAGDVIAFHEDGADWGVMELKNPEWRIVSVPGMSLLEAEALTAPELPPTLDKEYPMLRKRHMKLDLATLDELEAGKVLAPKTDKGDPKTPADVKALAVDAQLSKENVQSCMVVKEALK